MRHFERALSYLSGPAVIFELGTVRNKSEAARESDGWSTLWWARYVAEHGGHVWTWDKQQRPNVLARVLGPLREHVTAIEADASAMSGSCDLLYLDGPNEPAPHLAVFQACPSPLVLCDDVVDDDFGPKASSVVPAALAQGYRIAWHEGRHLLLEKS